MYAYLNITPVLLQKMQPVIGLEDLISELCETHPFWASHPGLNTGSTN